jgi:hypothetical protein
VAASPLTIYNEKLNTVHQYVNRKISSNLDRTQSGARALKPLVRAGSKHVEHYSTQRKCAAQLRFDRKKVAYSKLQNSYQDINTRSVFNASFGGSKMNDYRQNQTSTPQLYDSLSLKSRANARLEANPEAGYMEPTHLKPLVQKNVKLQNMISFPVDVLLHMQKMN